MKKIITLAAAALVTFAAQAQVTEQKALVDSKPWDNWYIGVNGGASVKTTHYSWMNNLNPDAGVRIGRWFTPCFGLVVDDNVYFNDRPNSGVKAGTIVKANQLNFGATVNFSNWFGGYNGEPRAFEVIAVPALGWSHAFGNSTRRQSNLNSMMAKIGLDFAYNFGKSKAFQIYLEPVLNYIVYSKGGEEMAMDINKSAFQLNVGFAYKFKNTNGTHNFKYGEPQSLQTDIDRISELTRKYEAATAQAEAFRAQAAQAQAAMKKAQQALATATAAKAPAVTAEPCFPVIVFKQGSAKIEKMQYADIEKVAKYLKANENVNVDVQGFASVEGGQKINDKLSAARAKAVADALVKKYGIAADRIKTSSFGATSDQSEERAFNRVVTFTEK